MNLEKHEIKNWLQKAFPSEGLTVTDITKAVHSMELSGEISESILFLYELAQVHRLAAFVLWNDGFQKRMGHWVRENLPGLASTDFTFSPCGLFPSFEGARDYLYLNNGKGSVLQPSISTSVARPLAFRELSWYFLQHNSSTSYSYDEGALRRFLKSELLGVAALVAGLKRSLYLRAVEYSKARVQGDRSIYQWSEVQKLLSQLHIVVNRDEKLVSSLCLTSAVDILSETDLFVSSGMQVFGGAGYTEDYKAERYFRECVFLKNWLLPLKETQIQVFVDEVLK